MYKDSSTKKKKIGLLGGTFDPPHEGHIWLGEVFSKEIGLDEIILMPTNSPPHKVRLDMADKQDRIEMCKLVAKEYPLFTLSTIEADKDKASFTVDTLKILRKKNPDVLWYLIVGADMFNTLRSWKNFEYIKNNCIFCTLPREGITYNELRDYADTFEKGGAKCIVVDVYEKDISSTEIRNAVAKGENIDGLTTKNVADYIKEKSLYKTSDKKRHQNDEEIFNNQVEKYKEIIKGRLKEKRYHHSLNVAKVAKSLADHYGADPKKAYIAGLLHDLMKDTSIDAQLQILDDFDIITNNVLEEKDKRKTFLHGLTASVFVENVLSIKDKDIINAIRYHTTGRAGMSLLEKVIFIADYISEERTYSDVEIVRMLANKNLDDAMFYCLSYTIKSLVDKKKYIHPNSFKAYNDLT